MNSSTSINGRVLPECIFHTIGGRLHQPSYTTQAVIIFSAVINAIASPITVVLNALLIIAMKKKPRLRAHKSIQGSRDKVAYDGLINGFWLLLLSMKCHFTPNADLVHSAA